MSIVIAAIFVQPDGCYANLPQIDLWPEERDARLYDGPWPVIAHPPCQRWGNLAIMNYSIYGGAHNRPGNDGGCFASALESVRRFGGVLEHPKSTRAFAAYGIPKPNSKLIGWQKTECGGWVCEVWQSAYGHKAAKATWLYYYGSIPPFELRWDRVKGTHQVSHCRGKGGTNKMKPALTKREANATPIEFREELLRLVMQLTH